MYRPPAFAVDDGAVLDAFIDAHPFALIVSSGADGPAITHAPVLRAADGLLACHLARPNPHCEALAAGAPTTIVFSGAHGYISPRWYAAGNAVPPWNYTAVHVTATPIEMADEGALRASMDAMLARFEPEEDIRSIVTDRTIAGMLRGIRGFDLRIERREGTFKLSQNRSDADREGVHQALSGGDGDARAQARAMRFAP